VAALWRGGAVGRRCRLSTEAEVVLSRLALEPWALGVLRSQALVIFDSRLGWFRQGWSGSLTVESGLSSRWRKGSCDSKTAGVPAPGTRSAQP
jgi:hypothetical protein